MYNYRLQYIVEKKSNLFNLFFSCIIHQNILYLLSTITIQMFDSDNIKKNKCSFIILCAIIISLNISYTSKIIRFQTVVAVIETKNNCRRKQINNDIGYKIFSLHLFAVFLISVGCQISIMAGHSLINPLNLVPFHNGLSLLISQLLHVKYDESEVYRP